MAKTIQTLSPELIRDIVATMDRLKRMLPGELRGDVAEPKQAPDDVVVMTPSGGIAARSGTTCYGEDCATYRIVDSDITDGEITLEAIVDGASDPLTAEVYNLSGKVVGGSKYVVTSRLKSGHRYAIPDPSEVYWYDTTGLLSGSYSSYGNSAVNINFVATVPSYSTDSSSWEIDNSNKYLICKKAGTWIVHARAIFSVDTIGAETNLYLRYYDGSQKLLEQARVAHALADSGTGTMGALSTSSMFGVRDFAVDERVYLQAATNSALATGRILEHSYMLTRI